MNNVELFDVCGRKQSYHHLITTSSHHLNNISNLPAGVYFLKLQTTNGVMVKKIIKM